jgi:oxygen-independent coproporphyrinogen-3 oxidase
MKAIIKIIESSIQGCDIQVEAELVEPKVYKFHVPHQIMLSTVLEEVCNTLDKKNYVHYEVSNFAKKGKESKHNINYWHNNEYYGFGLGAHGYIHGVRYENKRSLTKYIAGKYRLKEELLSKQDKMDNEIMLGLRLMEGINLKDFFIKYGINLKEAYDLHEVMHEEELIYSDGYIYINPLYIYVMNEILIKII